MLLMIDNYDSFTYNIVQYLGELGADVVVHRNDEISLSQIRSLAPEKIVLSPGPCTPNEAGISMDVVREFGASIPLLGIAWDIRASVRYLAARSLAPRKLCTAKSATSITPGKGYFETWTSPFQQPDIIP